MLPVWGSSHLDHLPGLFVAFDPHPHQLNALWRITGTDGNVLLGHRVDRRDEQAMVIAGPPLRRTGRISKPTYVVPNLLLGWNATAVVMAVRQCVGCSHAPPPGRTWS